MKILLDKSNLKRVKFIYFNYLISNPFLGKIKNTKNKLNLFIISKKNIF